MAPMDAGMGAETDAPVGAAEIYAGAEMDSAIGAVVSALGSIESADEHAVCSLIILLASSSDSLPGMCAENDSSTSMGAGRSA